MWGIIIVVASVVGCISPGEYAHSILTTETNEERPVRQLKEALRKISNAEPNPDDSEKLKLEKSILKSEQEIKNDFEQLPRKEGEEQEKDKKKEEINYEATKLECTAIVWVLNIFTNILVQAISH